METSSPLTDTQVAGITAVIDRVKADKPSLDTDEYVGQILDAVNQSAQEQTWTFFGHWTDDGELIIEHTVEGEHQDLREDDGYHPGGLWCDSASGADPEEAEESVRAIYE